MTVLGIDVNASRVERLSMGESFVEDIPARRIAAALSRSGPARRFRRPGGNSPAPSTDYR